MKPVSCFRRYLYDVKKTVADLTLWVAVSEVADLTLWVAVSEVADAT